MELKIIEAGKGIASSQPHMKQDYQKIMKSLF